MSDTFTETTTKGWGSRLMDSIKGIAIGFILFISSFGVLYWNEGRTDMSEVAATAIEISAESETSKKNNQQLVSTTGSLISTEKIGDMFLKKGEYLGIKRNVEMYAWTENEKTTTKTSTGGTEETTTEYSYTKEWTSTPASSSNFKVTNGHTNPAMTVESSFKKVSTAQLGKYSVDIGSVELPAHKKISLTKENVLENEGFSLANEKYLFKASDQYLRETTTSTIDPNTGKTLATNTSAGTISSPQVGDLRISYSVVKNPMETATLFGKLEYENNQITPFYTEDNDELYRVFDETRDAAISRLSSEHSVMTWILRAVGFIMMWIGLQSIFSVISVFLDVLPFLGTLSKGLIKGITFVVAAILSLVTILISMILHNIWAVIIVVILISAGIYWYVQEKSHNTKNSENS